MTDSPSVEGIEHFFAVGGLIFAGVAGLLAWASGSREGKHISAEIDRQNTVSATAAAVGGATGAGLIDLQAYRAVIDGMEAIRVRLDAMDAKLARIVELEENQDEREERVRQHRGIMDEFRSEMRVLADELRADMIRGDERRAIRQPK